MTKRLFFAFIFLSWHLVACSNGDSKMRVKITGEDLYISAKLDAETDILYWFKKCMFNELFTFYRVGTIANSMPAPTTLP